MKTDNILTEEAIEEAFLLDHSLCSGAAAHVKKGGARSLKAGGLWIYDNEIDHFEGDFEDGDILAVKDFDGYFLGWGFVNRKSRICIRMLSRKEEPEVKPSFLKKRVRAAWEYRKKVIDTSSCRVIFGEADFRPVKAPDPEGAHRHSGRGRDPDPGHL